ncbi:MAG TPA: hypothetical protein VGB82_15285 [Alphaproteobacteria bacterium]
MRNVLLASVAVFGLAATPLMAQNLNTNDSTRGSVSTPEGGANVGAGANGSLSGSGGDIDKTQRPGAASGRSDRDPSLATVPDRDDANKARSRTQMRDRDRDHDADQIKKDR